MSKTLLILVLAIFLLPNIQVQAISNKQNRNQNKWNLCQKKTNEMLLIENSFAKVGASTSQIKIAQKVACFESNMNCQITSKPSRRGQVNYGLFQINSVHRQSNMLDCQSNINYAIKLSNNGKNWRPWSALKIANTVK